MEILNYLNEQKKYLEWGINLLLDDIDYPKVISEGMLYSLLNGGKKIRPTLLFMGLELLGLDKSIGLPSAVAIEMIHSYSLVHDDLPALDNDDYRRGKLTTHKKYGEAQAILIGDALLTHAFYILTEKNNLLSPKKIVNIVKLTSLYSGINGMIGGQTLDILSEGKKIDYETLKYIHKNKTGKLLKLPLEIACIIGDANKKDKEAICKYADLIGLAFQIKDDILDIEGNSKIMGKPIGSDEKLNKSTYPSIFGIEKSKEILNETIKEAKEIILSNFQNKGDILIQLADYIVYRDK